MVSKTYVLDTSAIIYGFNPRLVEGTHYITPGVEAELYAGRTRSVTEVSIASGRLRVRAPRPEYVAVVKTCASSTGDLTVLSETDLEVVALALELEGEGENVLVVSDDYSLQNLCTLLSINFKPMVTKGISEEFWWFLYCPACGATYDQSKKLTACQVCGHSLKRKVYSKRKITGSF
ncbi:MAG: hypothetical protein NQU41_00335 [Candidatus Methanosuratincola sp.]|nr:hypothetical protein [Candidatus Methanosuratincola sp.]